MNEIFMCLKNAIYLKLEAGCEENKCVVWSATSYMRQ